MMDRNAHGPYGDVRFWRAYARLLYCVRNGTIPSGLSNVCDAIIRSLDLRTSDSEPVRVLCLGFGVGVFEFPLLHCLRRQLHILGRDVEITAIDVSGGAIACAARLATHLLPADISQADGFPCKDSGEFASMIEGCWPAKSLEHGEVEHVGVHTFRCLDIDTDSARSLDPDTDSPLKELARYLPSRWFETLPAEKRYHLVTSMFCLHHLEWWRATLVATTCQLLSHEGGLVLIPELKGATDAFAGNPVFQEDPQGLLECLREVMYAPSEGQDVASDPRLLQARQTLPVVSDFLSQLGGNELDEQEITFQTQINPSVCADLLETRGFSVLRDPIMRLRAEVYQRRCKEFRSLCRDRNYATSLVTHQLTLRSFCFRGNGDRLALFAQHFGIMPRRDDEIGLEHVTYAYQLREAGLTLPLSGDLTTDREIVFARDTVPNIIHSGVLHPECIGLTIGPGLVRRDKLGAAVCCPNVFHAENGNVLDENWQTTITQLEDLLVFLRLRQDDDDLKDFSNAHLVLSRLVPLFSPTPSVFTYVFDCEREPPPAKPFFSIKIERRRAFWEVRHIIKTEHPYAAAIHEWGTSRTSLGRMLWENLLKYKLKRKRDGIGRYRLPHRCPAVWVEEWDAVADKYLDEVFTRYKEEVGHITGECFGQLKKYADDINHDLVDQLRKRFPSRTFSDVDPVFDQPAVKAMAWLLVMKSCRSVAMYPTYFVEGNRIAANDATLVMYTRTLNASMIEGEFAKFNAIYDSARLRGSELAGERAGEHTGQQSASANFAHELKRVPNNLVNLVHSASLTPKDGGRPLFSVETARESVDTGGILGTITLSPETPALVRKNIGVCFFPQGVKDIAGLIRLWCQASAEDDLTTFLDICEKTSSRRLVLSVWDACLRLLSLNEDPRFAMHRKGIDERRVLAGLHKELNRLTSMVESAQAAGLTLDINGAADTDLAGYDWSDVGWLGRALWSILFDFVLYSKLPATIVVAIDVAKGTLEVRKGNDSGPVSNDPVAVTRIEDARSSARSGFREGSWHTPEVVRTCLRQISGNGDRDAEYNWLCSFTLQTRER